MSRETAAAERADDSACRPAKQADRWCGERPDE